MITSFIALPLMYHVPAAAVPSHSGGKSSMHVACFRCKFRLEEGRYTVSEGFFFPLVWFQISSSPYLLWQQARALITCHHVLMILSRVAQVLTGC
uniref:Secreted protein n=1 Tax=Anguilla anguilla TaxID=7936 RepID=A0A0E9PNT3_ANGAN